MTKPISKSQAPHSCNEFYPVCCQSKPERGELMWKEWALEQKSKDLDQVWIAVLCSVKQITWPLSALVILASKWYFYLPCQPPDFCDVERWSSHRISFLTCSLYSQEQILSFCTVHSSPTFSTSALPSHSQFVYAPLLLIELPWEQHTLIGTWDLVLWSLLLFLVQALSMNVEWMN